MAVRILTGTSTLCTAAVNIGRLNFLNRRSAISSVIRVSSGNFLEMYDFMVFGYYATAIGKAFFPTGSSAMVVFLTEIMPIDVRTSGFALAYSLATAIFGGFTPAISTYLIHATHNPAVPGLWLSAAAMLGLIGAYFARPQRAAAY